jgi:hypothetical protein
MTDEQPTPKQKARQAERYASGRYRKFPPCDGCGKAMGSEFISHAFTDCVGDDGVNWHNTALTLCDRCAIRTDHMRNVSEFIRYRDTGWY